MLVLTKAHLKTREKTMKGKEKAIKVKHEEKCEDNELMKQTLLCTGMTVGEKLMYIILAEREKHCENIRNMILPDSFNHDELLE